jgi:hypothetical protein
MPKFGNGNGNDNVEKTKDQLQLSVKLPLIVKSIFFLLALIRVSTFS